MPQHELLACAQCGCFAFSCFEDFAIRVNNIRLLCSAHNDYMAERVYGKEKMDQYRVREPSPKLQLRLDGVDREPNIVR